MRFTNRLVGLHTPNWKKISIAIAWTVFGWNFMGLPFVRVLMNPKPSSDKQTVTLEFFQASIDTAQAMAERAKSLGNNYRASDYARDMAWLRLREHQVRDWQRAHGNTFDSLVVQLNRQALASERIIALAQCNERGRMREMCERGAMANGEHSIINAVNEMRQTNRDMQLVDSRFLGRLGWHFAKSNLWAMLATVLLLLLRLGFSKKHSLKDELLLTPGRFLWSCFWWGYGISEYPGNDFASELRYVRLRNKFLKGKDTWELSKEEEAALWLMAHQPVVQFDEALATVVAVGGVIPPRRTLLTTILLMLTSGVSSRTQLMTTATVVVQLTPGDETLEQLRNHPIGGTSDPSADASPVILPEQVWEFVRLMLIGVVFILIDARRKFRCIRVMGSRAPPITLIGDAR